MSERDQTAEILARIDRAWDAFLAAMAGLDDEALQEPGVAGAWSVKDVMAHITTWEEHVAPAAERATERGRQADVDVDAINAAESARRSALSVDEVRVQLVATHAVMMDRLRALPRIDPVWVAENTYEHYAEHAEDIRRWRSARGRSTR